jgi:hypothetical protein
VHPIIRKLTLAAVMVVVLSGIVMSAQVSLAATQTLKDILPDNLKKGLTPAEKVLLEDAQKGVPADFRTVKNKEIEKIDPKDDPANAKNWGRERTIRAEIIRWLCTGKAAASLVDAKGILIVGANIKDPLDLQSATIPYTLVLFNCALETVTLVDTSAQSLVFSNSVIGGFTADRLKTSGSLFMNNVKAAGEVRLTGADIGGGLECKGAKFNNPGGNALHADELKVKENVFLSDGFKAVGEVRLLYADIGGGLECKGAEFKNPGGYALSADGIKVKGNVFLSDGFKAIGEISLPGADIGGDIDCIGADLNNPNGFALNCQNTKIKGALLLRQINNLVGMLYLPHMKAEALVDDKTGWPVKGTLYIEGFEYGDLICDETLTSASERIKWLQLQPTKPFFPQPYEHLAKVFRDMGRESDAREVLIAMHKGLRSELGPLALSRKWFKEASGWGWDWFLWFTIRYGYEPGRAVFGLILFWLVGWGVFYCAGKHGNMHYPKERRGQTLNSFIYSLDVLLPIINFHQKDFFLPNANKPWGKWVRVYFWIQIGAGWILTTLAVVALTGLVHK